MNTVDSFSCKGLKAREKHSNCFDIWCATLGEIKVKKNSLLSVFFNAYRFFFVRKPGAIQEKKKKGQTEGNMDFWFGFNEARFLISLQYPLSYPTWNNQDRKCWPSQMNLGWFNVWSEVSCGFSIYIYVSFGYRPLVVEIRLLIDENLWAF